MAATPSREPAHPDYRGETKDDRGGLGGGGNRNGGRDGGRVDDTRAVGPEEQLDVAQLRLGDPGHPAEREGQGVLDEWELAAVEGDVRPVEGACGHDPVV